METQLSALKKKHILVVDDDVQLAQFYRELLQAHDYRTSTAANGVQALKLVLNIEVDAVLCDLNMPELAGDMFYTAIGRVRPQLQKRFIFFTGNANHPHYAEFIKKVKVPVLAKPVSLDVLLQTLGGLFAKP